MNARFAEGKALATEAEDGGIAEDYKRCIADILYCLQEAEALFERMRVLGFIPNRFSYSALMKAHLEAKQYRRVLGLGMEMRGLNVETNVVIQNLVAAAESGLADATREELQLTRQT